MTRALHELIQSPEGVLTLCAAVLTGLVVGVLMMAFLDWAEGRTRARLQRQIAMRPRIRSEIIASETPRQRLVREAEQHERKSA
jgi:hypothetical protein